jgi:hypothetical protein
VWLASEFIASETMAGVCFRGVVVATQGLHRVGSAQVDIMEGRASWIATNEVRSLPLSQPLCPRLALRAVRDRTCVLVRRYCPAKLRLVGCPLWRYSRRCQARAGGERRGSSVVCDYPSNGEYYWYLRRVRRMRGGVFFGKEMSLRSRRLWQCQVAWKASADPS